MGYPAPWVKRSPHLHPNNPAQHSTRRRTGKPLGFPLWQLIWGRLIWSIPIATAVWGNPSAALGQSILPLAGSATQVVNQGNEWLIQGGHRSRNGHNLFHQFQRFNLDPGALATFQSAPQIRYILGQVLGGEASRIDGIVQVVRGQSHLLLVNPAGILTGVNARIDVPGGFTATTADGIWFSAPASLDAASLGASAQWLTHPGPADPIPDYGSFNGSPEGFGFRLGAGGVILQEGQIQVGGGQALRLIGSQVIQTGSLRAPGGTITLLSVAGGQRVSLGADGRIELGPDLGPDLGSDLGPSVGADGGPVAPLRPASLAQLLSPTSLPFQEATRLVVDSEGRVHLLGREIPTMAGLTLTSGDLSGAAPGQGGPVQGGTVQVLGDRVGVLGGRIDAGEGGAIAVGGAFQGQPTLPSAQGTFVAQGAWLNADASASDPSQGHPSQGHPSQGGEIVVWATGQTIFQGTATARGSLAAGSQGGRVEISGLQQLQFDGVVQVDAPAGTAGSVWFDPRTIRIVDTLAATDDNQLDANQPAGDPLGQILSNQGLDQDFILSTAKLRSLTGQIILQASDSIQIDAGVSLDLPNATRIEFLAGGDFRMDATQAIRTYDSTAAPRPEPKGDIVIQANRIFGGSFNAGDPDGGRVSETAGDVRLTARGDIQAQGVLGKTVVIRSDEGNIDIARGSNAEEGSRAIRAQTVQIQAPQGAIALDGAIQAGEAGRPTDGRISIVAARFRASNPFLTGAPPFDGGVIGTQPMNLWVFPANTFFNPSDLSDVGPGPLPQARLVLQFGTQPPRTFGQGTATIAIRLLQDTQFSIGSLPTVGSGSLGGIGTAVAAVPPNVNPLVANNEFTTLDLPDASSLEALLELDPSVAQAFCPPRSPQPVTGARPLLQASRQGVRTGNGAIAELTPEMLGLPPLPALPPVPDPTPAPSGIIPESLRPPESSETAQQLLRQACQDEL